MPAPPARGASSLKSESYFFFALFFAAFFAFFFAVIELTSSLRKLVRRPRSEQSALAPGQARCLPGAAQPFLELSPGYPPDPTDPHRGYPRRVRVVHRAESAQDGRGMNAQALRDLVGREVFVVSARPDCAGCDSCVSGPSLLHLRGVILTACVKREFY